MSTESQDRKIFRALCRTVHRQKALPETAGERVLRIGRYFLGAPYTDRTLEKEGPEALVVNLRQFDCFTFVENTIALAGALRSGEASFDGYREILTAIRYRQGRPDGYASRLHYFSDWIFECRRKGILQNINPLPGTQRLLKKIDFMTRHADQYPALQDRDVYRQMRAVERRLQKRICRFIPKSSVKKMEDLILDGDLIAVTTAATGLDVMHVGLAVHLKKTLHLLHASRTAGKVVISGETLDRYLSGNASRTGIMIALPAPHHFLPFP
jgi:hypothetical protein